MPLLPNQHTGISEEPWALGLGEKKRKSDYLLVPTTQIRVEFLERIGGGLWMELAVGEGRKHRLEKQS